MWPPGVRREHADNFAARAADEAGRMHRAVAYLAREIAMVRIARIGPHVLNDETPAVAHRLTAGR